MYCIACADQTLSANLNSYFIFGSWQNAVAQGVVQHCDIVSRGGLRTYSHNGSVVPCHAVGHITSKTIGVRSSTCKEYLQISRIAIAYSSVATDYTCCGMRFNYNSQFVCLTAVNGNAVVGNRSARQQLCNIHTTCEVAVGVPIIICGRNTESPSQITCCPQR